MVLRVLPLSAAGNPRRPARAMASDQPVSFISYDTIGRVAAEAFVVPERINDAEIALADEYVSHAQVAAMLEEVTGKAVTVTSVDTAKAVELRLAPRVAHAHLWLTDVAPLVVRC
ncbi:NmrA family NAD(P)-binding protein [Cupriavidus necator]|uniref:NmrA family NAD(P)-binding protein n=2 Tax=Cupriavidus necator TaxID=106590 RepID=UPI001E38FB1E|nr:NmrA family NAD(P)-binding protein [Cupriavidus necator]